ncbi:MAG: VCBS repeat-containing protein [Flavobacteriales bacterium]|nr:VCBS repeat-containing protein [Flavobacteriales bacterium]
MSQFYTNVANTWQLSAVVNNNLHGAGVSCVDIDLDGWEDITFATDTSVVVYRNINGIATELDLNLPSTPKTKQPVWVDYDNDGDMDLYLSQYLFPCRLFRNEGGFVFTDVTVSSGLQLNNVPHFGCSWGDYDRDGDLDLYQCTYIFVYSGQGPENYYNKLYRNEGNGTFTEVGEEAGVVDGLSLSFQSIWLDYNRDLWPDLYVINDKFHPNRLYHNNGDGTFSDVSYASGAALADMDAMTASAADFNHDGWEDIFISNTSIGTCALLRNDGDGTFTNIAATSGLELEILAWGGNWFDFDLDMDQDLYVCEYNPLLSTQANRFMVNMSNANFVNLQTSIFPFDFANSYATATCDWNHDGCADLAVNNYYPQNCNFWKSSGSDNHALTVSLSGTISNTLGVGTHIGLYAGGIPQYRYTYCGENYLGQNSLSEIFGLNDETVVDSLLVWWPSGHTDKFYNLSADTSITVIEGSGLHANILNGDLIYLCPGDSVFLSSEAADTYNWNNGATTQGIWVHTPGLYSLSITSMGFASYSDTVQVAFSPQPEVEIVTTDVSCFGLADGQIQIVGVENALIYFNGQQFDGIVEGIPAGPVSFEFSDGHGCIYPMYATINTPDQLYASFDIAEPSCFDSANGLIALSSTNAVGAVLTWEDGSHQILLDGLESGVYNWWIEDQNGCVIADSVVLTAPNQLAITTAATDLLCHGDSSGTVSIMVAGGSPPYLLPSDTLGLSAGYHTFTITDQAGCALQSGYWIYEPDEIEVDIDMDGCNLWYASVLGGTAPHAFTWLNENDEIAGTGDVFENPVPGSYRLRVVDANNCFWQSEWLYCVGMTEMDNQLQVYPNPCSANCLVTGTSTTSTGQLFASDGRLILRIDGTTGVINVEDITEGIYYLRWDNPAVGDTVRLVVVH